jgi:microcystin-dependent protein
MDIIRYLIIFLVIVLLIIFLIGPGNGQSEHMTAATATATSDNPISNEAVQDIASVYNKDELIITNIISTGIGTFNDLVVNGKFNVIPRGVIVAFSGSDIPQGWALCDGDNGTPNLIDKFILGSRLDTMSQTGGRSSVTLTINELPAHTHRIELPYLNVYSTNDKSGDISEGKTWKSIKSISDTQPTGLGQPFEIMPPYYRLVYIMKL